MLGLLFVNEYSKIPIYYIAGSSNGRTAGSGPAYLGSNPSPAANRMTNRRQVYEEFPFAVVGVIVEKNGKIFEFTVLVNQGNAERIRCAELIQKYLKDVGIRMNIRVIEWSSMINEFINKRRFEAVLMGWFLSRDPDCYDIWHSSKTKEGELAWI